MYPMNHFKVLKKEEETNPKLAGKKRQVPTLKLMKCSFKITKITYILFIFDNFIHVWNLSWVYPFPTLPKNNFENKDLILWKNWQTLKQANQKKLRKELNKRTRDKKKIL